MVFSAEFARQVMARPAVDRPPFEKIEFENRLEGEVQVRTEMRGKSLVIILEPGRTANGLIVAPRVLSS